MKKTINIKITFEMGYIQSQITASSNVTFVEAISILGLLAGQARSKLMDICKKKGISTEKNVERVLLEPFEVKA